MESVAPRPLPDDEQTPTDGVRELADELARLKDVVGVGREDGLRGEQWSITKAINVQTVLLQRLDERLIRMEAQRVADRLDDEALREAERQADTAAAKKRHAEVVDKANMIVAGQVATAALFVLGALIMRGCL